MEVRGKSSREACCKCNGGHQLAQPFKYPDQLYQVGGGVWHPPTPRTVTWSRKSEGLAVSVDGWLACVRLLKATQALFYTINPDCEFPLYNLTLLSDLGLIVYGGIKPTEPFEVTCEVTAHEAPRVTFTTIASIKVGQLFTRSEARGLVRERQRCRSWFVLSEGSA